MSWNFSGSMNGVTGVNMGPVHNTGNMGPVNVGNNAGLYVNGPVTSSESSSGNNSQGQGGKSGSVNKKLNRIRYEVVLVPQAEYQQNVNNEESAIFDKLSIIGQGLDDKNKVYREVENLKKVNSAYIAKYYDWWIGEKTFYIIMEYCPDTLRKIIKLRPAVFTRDYGKTMGDWSTT
ncbi:unnamed protein product [Oppiella nova]|uniref:Uncharacterized protein n=1 Tax=Oppiella nova TaxID=334625 RepID=A0A7R9QM86_9ACAR|nr:unnamed protein product [Oppiella nova]CAG2168670.1 unnamed protein product [Oppiella nova]